MMIMGENGKKKQVFVAGGMLLLTVALNVAAWNSTAFSDWYIGNIFPVWVYLYGGFTNLFPFSVGEWMLGAGVLLIVIALLLGLVLAVTGPVRRLREGSWRRGLGRFAAGYYRFLGWTILTVALVMTLNCFILYHGSTFSEQYFGEDSGEHELTELIAVYNRVTEECNRLAAEIERDDRGRALYAGADGSLENLDEKSRLRDMADSAGRLMQELGEEYPRLRGFYPRPKALLTSDFMCQQHMQGYYFPFSMEANYNDVMYSLNIPATMCHELAHLKGYIFEDEANFIAYLACIQSEDAFIQYSGYLSVFNYLYRDLKRAERESQLSYAEAAGVIAPVSPDSRVWEDNIFVTQEEWDRINKTALLDTELVDQVSDVFIDTNLKVNGITDGAVSYSRVVKLLLQYYREQPNLLN